MLKSQILNFDVSLPSLILSIKMIKAQLKITEPSSVMSFCRLVLKRNKTKQNTASCPNFASQACNTECNQVN